MTDAPPTDAPVRITLRQLPLPARLVLSAFLIAVGLGYVSALVQLHLQHSSKEGEALPTVDDVVEVFAGLKKADPNAPPPAAPASKLERLVVGPVEAPFNGNGSMSPAFFHKDGANYRRDLPTNPNLKAEREGEQLAVQAWIKLDPASRGDAYREDRMPRPDNLRGQAVTPDYLADGGTVVKVKSIITDRCVRCHAKGEEQEKYPLETYDQLLKYMDVPQDRPAPPPGYVWSDRQVSVEKLTQSTHAHLLSFAVLFMLTGLTFAFTSYPAVIRGILGPVVLVTQVIDVSCWWLARVPDHGHRFAQAIVMTGGVVGSGLMLQIVLGLLNMYGSKGKAVVVLLFVLGAGVAGYIGAAVVKPELDAERAAAERQRQQPAAVPVVAPAPPAAEKKDGTAPEKKKEPVVGNQNPPAAPEAPKGPPQPPAPAVTRLEKLIMGPKAVVDGVKFDGEGTMAPAFFEKDSSFRREIKERPRAEVEAEREGERQALVAWIRLDPTARKTAFEADALPLPAALKGKPVTPDYLSDDKATVKVKSIITDRCARCHAEGSEQEKYPLETYEQIAKYVDGGKPIAATPPVPPQPVATGPTIPPARD